MQILSSIHYKTYNILAGALVTFSFLLFTAACSGQSTTPSYSDDLAYLMPKDLIFTLPVTVNNTTHNVPIIKYTARQPIVKGVTLIIGDIQANGNLDSKLHMLAKTLPDWGWNTLLVMPRFDYITTSLKDDSTTNKSSEIATDVATSKTENASANEASNALSPQVDIEPHQLQSPNLPYAKQDYVKFISNLTNELNKTIIKDAGYQLIYAKGQSASVMIDVLYQQEKSKTHALVVNNPYWPSTQINQLLPTQLAKLPIPVLDLVSLSDNLWAKDTINTRRIAAKVGLKSLYRQKEVFGEHAPQAESSQLSKEIISWTYFLGW